MPRIGGRSKRGGGSKNRLALTLMSRAGAFRPLPARSHKMYTGKDRQHGPELSSLWNYQAYKEWKEATLMANQQHLYILKQGIQQWNQWRQRSPTIQPDLSKIDLSRAELSFVNLSQTNLSYCNLTAANLGGANLKGADLSLAILHAAILATADLSYANLMGADLTDADLRQAKLCSANLHIAKLNNSDLRDADLTDANLDGATLDNAKGRKGRRRIF